MANTATSKSLFRSCSAKYTLPETPSQFGVTPCFFAGVAQRVAFGHLFWFDLAATQSIWPAYHG